MLWCLHRAWGCSVGVMLRLPGKTCLISPLLLMEQCGTRRRERSHPTPQGRAGTWLQVPSPLPLAATIARGSAFSAIEFPATVPHEEMMAGWGGRD